ncbi:MAG: hypothetical protein QMD11_04885 [Smithella sp.]|nr:hypothetical protein [Smithella sp.]
MAYTITVIHKQDYVHFIVEGENTLENTINYLMEIHEESVAKKYKRILIEERLEGPLLGTMDIYDIVSKASQDFFGSFSAIAYVDIQIDSKTINFIENLGVNRSLPLHAFSTVEKAEKWLISKK